MKKFTYIISAIFVLLATSCANELEIRMQEGKFSFSSINASMADLPTSRAHLEGGGKVVWDAGDKVGIFSDTQTTPMLFECTNINESNASFTSGNEVSGSNFFAYYPYENTTINENTMTYPLFNTTEYKADTYFRQCPMVAQSATNEFGFKHTCGIIRFSITGTQRIQSLVLEGNDGEVIAGTGTIDLNAETPVLAIPADATDANKTITMIMNNLQLSSIATDFYFVVPEVTFTEGLSLTINYLNDDSSVAPIKKTTTKSITISRSVIKSFSVIDTDALLQEQEDERIYAALMAFYNATGGDNWTNNTNWGSDKPFSEWYGITTNGQGDISSIFLPYNNLTGYIPTEVGEFEYLYLLGLYNNNLSKTIPNSIGNLKDLKDLFLENNRLYGSIPNTICKLKNLERLDLCNNRLSGTLPSNIGDMESLEYLSIGSSSIGTEGGNIEIEIDENGNIISIENDINQISGEIPQSICKLKKLKTFDAVCNKLSGNIPVELWSIPALESVLLSGNYLTGELPSSIGDAKNLVQLWLSNNHLTGEIPPQIFNLVNLEELFLGNAMGVAGVQMFDSFQYNKISGNISNAISNMQKMRQFDVECLQLTGTIPDALWNIPTLEWALMGANYFEGTLSSQIINAKNLKEFRVDNNNLSGEIPNELCQLHNLESFSIGNSTTYNGIEMNSEMQMNSISGSIPKDISNLIKLSYFNISNNNITGGFPEYFVENPMMKGIVPLLSGNRMSGDISENIMLSENWKSWNRPDIYILPQQEGYGFTLDIYTSTDFSKDGEVITLQQATIGNGIDIVLMGDGYSDRLITNGTYNNTMKLAMEKLFSVEPYKSYREYFNVYAVKVVSANEVYTPGAQTALSCYFGDGTLVGGNDQQVFNYAQKAITTERMDEALLVVMMNSTNYAGTCYMYNPSTGNYSNGVSISYFPVGVDETALEQIIHHEAAGHGFAKLADEYAYEDMGTVPTDYVAEIKEQQTNWGWWKNVDFTNDPSSIRWSKFINDTRYANDGLDAYEGGLTYWTGVWRSTENSIMRYNTGGFNAPSREVIYYRINKLAYGEDWQYDYEKFVEYDAINRNTTISRSTFAPKQMPPLHEPIIIKDSWKNAKSNVPSRSVVPSNNNVIKQKTSSNGNAPSMKSTISHRVALPNGRIMITTHDVSGKTSVEYENK